eukprot:gene9229-10203_t
MELPSTPEEPTTVIRIMDDLDTFLHGKRSRRQLSRSGRVSAIDAINLDSSGSKSPLEFSKEKEIELLTSKAKISKLENQLKNIDTERKRSKIEEERDALMKERKYMKIDEEKQELQKKLKYILEKEENAREEISYLKKKLDSMQEKYIREADHWANDKKQYSKQLEQTLINSSLEITELRNKLFNKETFHYKWQAEKANEQLSIMQSKILKLSGVTKENADLANKLIASEQRCMAAEEALLQQEENLVVAKAMQGQILKYKDLDKQNNKLVEENKLLRDSRENAILLQEMLDSVKEKHDKAVKKLERLSHLELENEKLNKQLEKWQVEDAADGTNKARSPTELKRMVSDLQKSQISVMEKQGDLIARNTKLENSLQSLSEKYKQINDRLLEAQSNEKQQMDKCNRLQRKLLWVTTDRDGLRRVLNSYDTETASDYTPQLLNRVKEAEERVTVCNQVIDKMESEMVECQKELATHRLRFSKLQSESEMLKGDSNSSCNSSEEVSELKKRIEELQLTNAQLEEKSDILEARIEQRHLQGDFDPTKTKVVHFAGNPIALSRKMRAEELDRLRDENHELRRKLRQLRQDTVDVETDNNISIPSNVEHDKEIKELKSQLESSELRIKRLKEVFQHRVTAFRESIYQLFGYKHDMIASNKFQITSMYAERPDDKFVFENSAEGRVEMLDTEFPAQFPHAIKTFLQRGQSIPAFLSSVTLELFSKQTHIQDTTLADIATGKRI